AYALDGAKAVALGLGGEADPWFVYPLVTELAKKHPQDHALQLVLARSALAADDMTAALAAARAADTFGPGARAAELIAIQSRWNLGQHKAALADAAKALAAHSHDVGLRVFYANMLASAGKPRQAREALSDAKALDPDNPRIAFGYAMLAANTGDTAAARARLGSILESGGDDAAVYNLLGQLASDQKNWGEAFGWYQLDQAPDDLASSRVNSLFALYHWKGAGPAQDYLAQLQQHFPGLAPTWAGVRASLLDLSGQSEAAWQTLGAMLKRYPQIRPLRYQRALLADKLGKSGDALAALKHLVKEEPGSPLYLNAYGYTLVEHTDRYHDAYGYIKRALAVSPNDGAILDSMGWVLYRLGKPTRALGYLDRAWKQTDDPTVAFHLATVYLALNRRGEAGKVLHTALGKSPKDAKLLQLARKLARR
ncbi:MAG: tetratricopeptide repeat protein, partial [Gammaproteobacteria bacterium]